MIVIVTACIYAVIVPIAFRVVIVQISVVVLSAFKARTVQIAVSAFVISLVEIFVEGFVSVVESFWEFVVEKG